MSIDDVCNGYIASCKEGDLMQILNYQLQPLHHGIHACA